MGNFLDPKTGPFVITVLAGVLKPTLSFHRIAMDDMGWFVAKSFANLQA
jgi:hypothetical protein